MEVGFVKVIGYRLGLLGAVVVEGAAAAPERPKNLLKTFFTQLTEYKEKVYICTLIRKTGF